GGSEVVIPLPLVSFSKLVKGVELLLLLLPPGTRIEKSNRHGHRHNLRNCKLILTGD
ncbi:hypothetical protein HPB47_011826, partial [Ixodes persulcatus]